MKTLLSLFSILVLSFTLSQTAISQQVLTIEPSEPDVGNCYPFGGGFEPGDNWPPFMGFIYQNVPPFQLLPGDTLAFDLGEVNSSAVMLQIEMAATTANGGIDPVLPYTTLVTNNQTPLNPNGDTIIGNFEMMFTVGAPFNFPGGGLIIRFSNPSAAYMADEFACDQVLVHAETSDPSGNFVLRFFRDADGLPPYEEDDDDSIGGFRIISSVTNVPTLSEWGMIATVAGLGLIGFIVVRRRALRA